MDKRWKKKINNALNKKLERLFITINKNNTKKYKKRLKIINNTWKERIKFRKNKKLKIKKSNKINNNIHLIKLLKWDMIYHLDLKQNTYDNNFNSKLDDKNNNNIMYLKKLKKIKKRWNKRISITLNKKLQNLFIIINDNNTKKYQNRLKKMNTNWEKRIKFRKNKKLKIKKLNEINYNIDLVKLLKWGMIYHLDVNLLCCILPRINHKLFHFLSQSNTGICLAKNCLLSFFNIHSQQLNNYVDMTSIISMYKSCFYAPYFKDEVDRFGRKKTIYEYFTQNIKNLNPKSINISKLLWKYLCIFTSIGKDKIINYDDMCINRPKNTIVRLDVILNKKRPFLPTLFSVCVIYNLKIANDQNAFIKVKEYLDLFIQDCIKYRNTCFKFLNCMISSIRFMICLNKHNNLYLFNKSIKYLLFDNKKINFFLQIKKYSNHNHYINQLQCLIHTGNNVTIFGKSVLFIYECLLYPHSIKYYLYVNFKRLDSS